MKLRAEIVLKNAKIVPQGHHVTSGSRSNRKNPKILKVLLNSQFSRYRRKILYTETCTQALADGMAKRRHFHHLTLKLRSRSFSHLENFGGSTNFLISATCFFHVLDVLHGPPVLGADISVLLIWLF